MKLYSYPHCFACIGVYCLSCLLVIIGHYWCFVPPTPTGEIPHVYEYWRHRNAINCSKYGALLYLGLLIGMLRTCIMSYVIFTVYKNTEITHMGDRWSTWPCDLWYDLLTCDHVRDLNMTLTVLTRGTVSRR